MYKTYNVSNLQLFSTYKLPLPAKYLLLWDGLILLPGVHYSIQNAGSADQTFQLNFGAVQNGLQLGAGLIPVETAPRITVIDLATS